MPRSQQAKHSFAGGARTPRLSLRSDYNPYTERDAYNETCEYLRNWIVTPQGGIQFRQGFQNFRTESLSSDPTQDSRLFRYRRGGEVSDYIVHVTAGDGLIHFMLDNAMIADTVAHNYLASELDALWFTNKENIAILLHPDHPPLYITIALDGTITGAELESSKVPYIDYDDEDSPAASLTASDEYTCTWVDGATATWAPDRAWVFNYDGVYATGAKGNIKEYEYSATPAVMLDRISKALSFIPALAGSGTSYAVTNTGTDEYTIEITGQNAGKTMKIIPTNSRYDHYVSITNTMEETETAEPAWSYPTYVLEGGVYYQCILAHTPAVANQPPNATYWTPLAGKPDTFDWQYPDGNAWVADNPAGDRKAYSPGGRSFPTVGVFYEQRLLLMANPGQPVGVFGSRIAHYQDFSLGPQDDDPLFFAIDTSDSPKIKWAQAQRKLIIGTSSGDFSLQSDVTMTPSNVQATKQNAGRSHGTDAVTVNTDIFYIQQGQEKMRKTAWVDDLQAQYSADISLVAQDMLVPRAKRLALMETPEVIIHILREDGTLLAISYSPEQDTAAWFEYTSSGTIIDICGGYNSITSEDELWVLVTYDGGVTRWIEKMPYPARTKTIRAISTDDALVDQNIVCLDGWVSGTIAVGDNNIITGLDQFDGLTVTVMVDDAYVGEYLVFDGAILLDAPDPGDVPAYSGTYAVGFSYQGEGKTYEMVTGNPNGSGFGTKRRWVELWIRLLDSSLPKINGQLPEDRTTTTSMSVAEIIRSGKQDLVISNLGHDDGSIEILQDRPYPCHILGFFGKLEVENA